MLPEYCNEIKYEWWFKMIHVFVNAIFIIDLEGWLVCLPVTRVEFQVGYKNDVGSLIKN